MMSVVDWRQRGNGLIGAVARTKASAAGTRLLPIKLETGRQAISVLAQPRERLFAAMVARDLQCARSRDANLDLVTFLQLESPITV
jgi:hypothetical protein